MVIIKETINVDTLQTMQMLDITDRVKQFVKDKNILEGQITLFVPHTTAGITLNENTDPDVKTDMVKGLNESLPDRNFFKHYEGNSQAHILSSVIGTSLTLLISEGEIVLGTWQGIFFCEFDGPRKRKLHIQGFKM